MAKKSSAKTTTDKPTNSNFRSELDELLSVQDSFVVFFGVASPGSIGGIPSGQEPTKGPREVAPKKPYIEVFGAWTDRVRRRFSGESLDECVSLALKALNVWREENEKDQT